YETIFKNTGEILSTNLPVKYVNTTRAQIEAVTKTNCAYTILDSDQAIYYANQYDNLAINSTVLKKTARINHIGWACHPANEELVEELEKFVRKIKKRGDFNRMWREVYDISYNKYYELLEIIDETGTDLFKTSLDLAIMQQYEKSMELFQKARAMKFISDDMQKLYDKLYLSWLEKENAKDEGNTYQIVNKYLQQEPSEYFIKQLDRKYSAVYENYIDTLEEQRITAEENNDLEKAVAKQELLTFLKPRSFRERNTLRRLRKQLVSREQQKRQARARSNAMAQMDIDQALEQVEVDSNRVTQPAPPRAESEVEKKQIEKIKKTVKTTKDIEKYEGEKYFNSALSFFKNREYTNARDNFQKALTFDFRKQTAQNYINRINRILAEKRRRRQQQKLRLFDKYFNAALNHFSKEEYQQAMDNILPALELFPDNRLAQKYKRLIGENLKFLDDNRIDITSPYYDYYKAKLYQIENYIAQDSSNSYQQAKNICEDILNYFPQNEKAREYMLMCEYKLNPENFRTIVKTYFENGKMYLQNKQKQKALRIFQLIKKIQPGFTDIDKYIKRAEPKPKVQRRTIVTTGALGKKEKISADSENRKALALYKQGKLRQALQAYQRILRLFPNNIKAAVNLNRIQNELRLQQRRGRGRVDSAARKRAQKYYLTGQFYYRIKEYEKAIKQWRLAYKADHTFRKALIDIKRVQQLIK
ncbi:MAG TPA: tetratricopeptide repeat protein, partial [Spirochaetota bacterium]|nr:tetratricopeptide repeat protein [Spirochaetota bacterium]